MQRVLMLAGEGLQVWSIDRNPFNLRTDNLRLQAGYARGFSVAFVPGLDLRGLQPAKLPRHEQPVKEAA